MTKQRVIDNDKFTDFSAWLRMREEIGSEKGFITTDLDYLWKNYKTGQWMILEEKTHGATVPRWQGEFLQMIDRLGAYDKLYKGVYLIRFENTDPDNGRTMVNKRILSKEELIKFLKFELDVEPVPLHEVKPKGEK